ncbi:MAG TPA: ribose-5-phosphate isomerase RpiA [Hyphomicrobiaceae bacterium]|nr:ribose-5-phosphate isomerase RpiA [Hyphomicrobiaceae bacterium]
MTSEHFKRQAAERAIALVEDGMTLGLGTGSTAAHFVDLLGQRVRDGLKVVGVPTSAATRVQAERLGIPLVDLDRKPWLDLTVDGADEIDPELRLIKGGGGALLYEKIVAMASERMVVIADHSKRVDVLGGSPLPVEIVRFGIGATRSLVEALAADAGCSGEITLRLNADGQPFSTDSGNYILDCAFDRIDAPEALDEALKLVPGVVENGLFLGIADTAIVAGPDGVVTIERDEDGEAVNG